MLGSPRRFSLPSRLGDPAPQPKTGAARFASAATSQVQKKSDVITVQRLNVEASKRPKQPMTIRLTPAAIDKLSELERDLRRAGLRARRASASEIVEALVLAAAAHEVRDLLNETDVGAS